MAGLKDYSSVAASNTSLFPENMNPSAVNDGMRQVQADVVSGYRDSAWQNWGDVPSRAAAAQFKITGDVTSRYVVGRRVRCNDASTLYGVITASAYSAPDTTIDVTLDSGNLTASLTAVAIGSQSPTDFSLPKRMPFLEVAGAATISGAAVFKTTATVEGNATVSGAAVFKTTATVEGNATVSGAAVFKTTASVEGEATISGTLTLKTVVTGAGIATQAQQEAGSATNLIVTPGRQHYHPSAAKAQGKIQGTGTAAILYDYGIASITDNGTGQYRITWDTAFSTADYTVVLTPHRAATDANFLAVESQAAGNVDISCLDNTATGREDVVFSIAAFGDV
jgi:hypothetical protein